MSSLRLYCFPHAGGGASAYARWPLRLPPSIQVHRPQLPGRESRYGDPMPATLAALVASLAAGLGQDGVPFALFGHSFGGLVAFEVARALRRLGRPLPKALVISATNAPHLPDRGPILHQLSGPALAQELRRLGATEDLLSSPELMELMAPIIQTDSRLAGEHRHQEEPPLPCPIAVYGGEEDPTVLREDLEGWRAHTSGTFLLRTFRGGHMYLLPGADPFFERLAEDVLALSSTGAGTGSPRAPAGPPGSTSP